MRKIKHRHIIAAVAVAATVALAHPTLVALSKDTQHIGPDNLYPDAQLTPGLVATTDINELTAVNSCGTYSLCHRNTSKTQKDQACKEYPANCAVTNEKDHFCPLAIGCADDIRNLWSQPETNMWNGVNYGFHQKDALETYLAVHVKSGDITPANAQSCILTDWVACYQKYITTSQSFGSIGGDIDGDEVDN